MTKIVTWQMQCPTVTCCSVHMTSCCSSEGAVDSFTFTEETDVESRLHSLLLLQSLLCEHNCPKLLQESREVVSWLKRGVIKINLVLLSTVVSQQKCCTYSVWPLKGSVSNCSGFIDR